MEKILKNVKEFAVVELSSIMSDGTAKEFVDALETGLSLYIQDNAPDANMYITREYVVSAIDFAVSYLVEDVLK